MTDATTTDATPATADRADANALALRAVRQVLSAARDVEFTIEGMTIAVKVATLPAMGWPPRGITGLDEKADGPLPSAVRLSCAWEGGQADLVFTVAWWQTRGAYRHLIGIRIAVAGTGQEIVWDHGRAADTAREERRRRSNPDVVQRVQAPR